MQRKQADPDFLWRGRSDSVFRQQRENSAVGGRQFAFCRESSGKWEGAEGRWSHGEIRTLTAVAE